MNLDRQLRLLSIILPLKRAWFWTSVWLTYYLLFTDYGGVGIVETVVFVTSFFIEVPTGAISDLFGRKKTLALSFLLVFLGEFLMSQATGLLMICISVFIIVVAGSLFSGTDSAIVYDSLKEKNRENSYDKIWSKITRNSLIYTAIGALVGGWLWKIDISLPFIATSIAGLSGFVLSSLLLKEPKNKHKIKNISFRDYIDTTSDGFRHLFQRINKKTLLTVTLASSLSTILIQYMDDASLISVGHRPETLNIYFFISILIGAGIAGLYPTIKKRLRLNPLKLNRVMFLSTIIFAAIIPLIGFWATTAVIALRGYAFDLISLSSSEILNKNIDSKYRATAISSFNTLSQIPYFLSAVIIGKMIDWKGVGMVSLSIAVIFAIVFTALILLPKSRSKLSS